jgi:hypothetical protein
MVSPKTDKMFEQAGEIFQQAINEELLKKSKLGQYAIVERDGKPCRILASELIKNIPVKGRK